LRAILLPIQHPTMPTPIAHFISPKVDPPTRCTSTDSEVPEMTTGRIEALTDGIFAVAMTLLVLSLLLPRGWALMMEADDEMIETNKVE
jgi:hypothetical protein